MAFTDRTIKALKAKPERYEQWEDGRTGLGVRVTPRGVKSFVYMYRYEGRARRLTLGRYSETGKGGITLHRARVSLAEAKEKLRQGEDPGLEVVEERREERTAETFEELAELYLEKWARPRKRTAAEDERILRFDVIPRWGGKKANRIRKGDVIALLDDIVNRGAPIGANRTLSVVRKVFGFGLSRDITGLIANPCAGISPPSAERTRTRWLNDDEIKTFWTGLDRLRMSIEVRCALRLQLATGQRKAEVTGAPWVEFDLDEKLWRIPAERSKNGVEHLVPLNGVAIGVLKEMQRHQAEVRARRKEKSGVEVPLEVWVFPSPWGRGPITPESVNHALRVNLQTLGLEDARPHDLRRTAATTMGRLGVPRFIVSKVLNHVDRSVTGRYDVWEYLDEKRDALSRWGDHLQAVIAGKPITVVPMERRAG